MSASPDLQPALRGFFDIVSPDRIEGWVIDDADPSHRVTVHLCLGEAVLARSQADQPSPKLVTAELGISAADSDHGFHFTLLPAWTERRTALTLIAFRAGGSALRLSALHRKTDSTQAGLPSPAQMVQAIDQLFAEQRAMQSRLQALAPIPEGPAFEPSQDTEARLATLEAWVARLDEKLAALPAAVQTPAPRGLDTWQVVLLALLGLIGLGGLIGFALALAL